MGEKAFICYNLKFNLIWEYMPKKTVNYFSEELKNVRPREQIPWKCDCSNGLF